MLEVRAMDRYQIPNHMGGADAQPASGAYRPIVAPATGETIGRVAWSDATDVATACDAAAKAAPEWAALGMDERQRRIRAWGDALREEAAAIAYADAVDSGTPIRTMRTGIGKGVDYLDYFCGLWSEVKGETIPATPSNLHVTVREPYGVVGMVIPFNHPAFFAVSKTVPALLTGNTVVLKPSELTPVTAHLVARASADTLPPGVLNVVQGGPEVGRAIVAEPRLRRLHFTGGVRTGLQVQRGAADSSVVKQLTMELGGKNPLIVFPDVDPAVAAEAAVVGMNYTRNQGQSCGSTSRLFVHESIARAVVDEICRLVGEIRLGPPEDDDTQMGSLVSAAHQRRVLDAIDGARRDGARLLAGGSAPDGELAAGAYVEPTVFDRVDPGSTLAREEIFGPVLSVIEWSDRAEMLRQVNDSPYGLSAAVYTRDIDEALKTAAAVEAGYIWVNGVETRWKATPFGGYKDSGTGHEHDLAELLGYTRLKSVNVVLR
jgi:acyl-CoA reductase-like NAD-dependent aldehyde dehydrogenase